MSRPFPTLWGIWLLAAASATVSGQVVSPPAELRVDVTTEARALQPGEALLVRVRTSVAATAVTGGTPSGLLHFVRREDPLVWEALAGLDLKVKAGPYALTVRAARGDAAAESRLVLAIQPKRFPDRRIQVDPRFLIPPASELPRIERETKLVASVFASVSPERMWRGPFVRPVPGRETSAFGRVSIINGQRRSPHGGIDLAAAVGTPVNAPAAGRVVLSESLYFSGETIIVDHGLGIFSYLAHLSERRKSAGDRVEAGELVALSGVTGRITGPHLHWTVRVTGAVVNPMSVMWATEQTGR